MVEGMQVTLLEGGRQTLEVVGESHYQDNIHTIVEAIAEPDHYGHRGDDDSVRVPIHAVMVAETNNPYDSNAISLWIGGRKVGHLSREATEAYRPGLIDLQNAHGQPIALDGVVVGRPGPAFMACSSTTTLKTLAFRVRGARFPLHWGPNFVRV